MSWSRRHILAILAAAPLAGCGFHPLYRGEAGSEYDPTLAAIKVEPIADREGQILELALRDKLNPRGAAVPQRYTLQVALTLTRSDLGIQTNAAATASEINASASYRLIGDGVNVSGSTRTVSAFNLQNDAWAATVAENDARDRAVEELADTIVTQLTLWARRQEATR
ncbi:MAG: LPS assembly lipoprotein LptE [Stellaceae bacterium]